MVERITVHLEKKKEEYKEKGFEKSKINIVYQGNTKLESICVIDKNCIFASDCANEHIVKLTIKDDGYGFFALSQLVTSYLQNTEKVKCLCLPDSNLCFSSGSFIIM